jgi:hypothetical protein
LQLGQETSSGSLLWEVRYSVNVFAAATAIIFSVRFFVLCVVTKNLKPDTLFGKIAWQIYAHSSAIRVASNNFAQAQLTSTAQDSFY